MMMSRIHTNIQKKKKFTYRKHYHHRYKSFLVFDYQQTETKKTIIVSNITDTMTTDIDLPEKQRQKKIKFMVDMKLILILIFFLHFRLDLLRYDNGFLISFSFFFLSFNCLLFLFTFGIVLFDVDRHL